MKVSERRLGYIRQLDRHGQHTHTQTPCTLSTISAFRKNANMLNRQSQLIYHTVFLYRLCSHHHNHHHREYSVFQLPIIAVGLLATPKKNGNTTRDQNHFTKVRQGSCSFKLLNKIHLFTHFSACLFISFHILWRDRDREKEYKLIHLFGFAAKLYCLHNDLLAN